MDFDFSDDQVSLRDAVSRWVEKGFAFDRRHALAKAGGFTRTATSVARSSNPRKTSVTVGWR